MLLADPPPPERSRQPWKRLPFYDLACLVDSRTRSSIASATCLETSEIRSEVPTGALPNTDDLELLFLFYAVLALAKGEQTLPADVHNSWSAWMTARGQDHESLRPYWELKRPVKEEDDVYVAAIRKVARARASPRR